MKITTLLLAACLWALEASCQTQFTYFNKVFGGDTSNMLAQVIQPVSGGHLVIGSYGTQSIEHAIFIMKLDSQGNPLTFKDLVVGAEWGVVEDGSFVKPTSDGNFVCTIAEITYTPALKLIPHLLKFNSNGDTIWHKTYPNEYSQFTRSIIQTSDNGFAMAGYRYVQDTARFLLLKINEEGNYEWSKTYMLDHDSRAFSIQQTPWDGGYILGGWGYSTTTGYDMFVVKTTANGDTLWTKRYGNEFNDCAAKVVNLTTYEEYLNGASIEYLITACVYEGTTEKMYIAKINAVGNMIWQKNYNFLNKMGSFQVLAIIKDDKGFIGSGRYRPDGFTPQPYIASFHADGTVDWVTTPTINPGAQVYLKDLQPTPDGGYVLAGYQFTAPQTAWVLKIDAQGKTCSYVGCDSTVVVEVLPAVEAV